MFGYIAPQKSELLVRELALYNAYYCGLCRSIGSSMGEVARLTLSYDSTYIALLLCGLFDAPRCEAKRCAYKPLSKKKPFIPDSSAMRFCGMLNVCLAYGKKKDDWHDERNFISLTESAAIKHAAKHAEKCEPGMADAITAGVEDLRELERKSCADIDAPAEAFANMMKNAVSFAPYPDETARRVMMNVVYHMGRWLYLADAWDDREKDKKSGSYNPFNITGATVERASFLMNCSLNEARNAYDLLDIKCNRGILDNVIFEGCNAKTKCLLGGIDEQSL